MVLAHKRKERVKVTRIDRLARSIGDLQDIVRQVKARGASLRANEQPIDTGTAVGKCFLDMLGVFAEFETNLSEWAARKPMSWIGRTFRNLHAFAETPESIFQFRCWERRRILDVFDKETAVQPLPVLVA
jgi:Resolvase, N terminal domain